MRYGCRHLDVSSELLASNSTESARKNNRKAIRNRPRDSETRRGAVKDAAKRKHRKSSLCRTNRCDFSFVYVGNIDPSINEHRLEEYFSKCGKVCRIQLRCSRGQAVNIGIAIPEHVRTSRDRQYATVEFRSYREARNALYLNGKRLDGCKLVVSITPTDLPEVQDIVDKRISDIKIRTCKDNGPEKIWSARALKTQPTEVTDIAHHQWAHPSLSTRLIAPSFGAPAVVSPYLHGSCLRFYLIQFRPLIVTKLQRSCPAMARSAMLNPTSVPFFPGVIRSAGEDSGGLRFGSQGQREQDQHSISSMSISPSEYRSITSSPSSLSGKRDYTLAQSPEPLETSQTSAVKTSNLRRYPVLDPKAQLDPNTIAPLNTVPTDSEVEDNISGPSLTGTRTQTPGSTVHSLQHNYEKSATPPVSISFSGASSRLGGVNCVSPVSSLDSGSHFSVGYDNQITGFDAQLRASPLILDILDRLSRCEVSARDIQQDLGEVHRKVDLLLERTLVANSQPEFKDPFASNSNMNGLPSQFAIPRPSIGNIAPNQVTVVDDISTISQRLNTLTSSVGQLLALQTQQLQTNTDLRSNSVMNANVPQPDIAANQLLPSVMGHASIGHGLPRQDLRPSPRSPNVPLRTWSAGNLDLSMRPGESSIIRQEPVIRDKRRSVATLRRESTSVSEMDGSSRDNGPVVTKWEQLSLSPELLRSLTKFGLGPPNKIQQRALPFLLRGADIIAQAPPTQERIAAYVIPAIQIALTSIVGRQANRGPVAIMVSTTVDQATQAQRMIRDLGGPIGIRSALGIGAVNASSDLSQELRALHQNMPHIICGTPHKLHALFTLPGGLVGSDVRFLVLDEVDQLIARNLHDYVLNVVKLLPPPRSRPLGSATPVTTSASVPSLASGFEVNSTTTSPFQGPVRRFSTAIPSPNPESNVERQTALFSNTVPQDVLNLASAIHLREPVRVLVRRDGNASHLDNPQGSRGLRQYYLYLAFTTGSGRSDTSAANMGGGLGIIGSGRGAANPETAQAREWKLDALADLFDDLDVQQAIVHVGGMTALDAVVYKLASRGLETVPLHGDMNAATKLAALNKFKNLNPVLRQPPAKVLVVYDVPVKTPEVSHVSLIINYDLPKAVEDYAHRVAPAIASNYSRAGVVINFVTATGGDVEMLRSIECFYKIKCPEVPMSLRDII
ncbi:hypothetical protein APHAL10511_001805 [Amanita phalloides]|nr:hypothetical protein APHAL10511_001805 [Amanita phalloides]